MNNRAWKIISYAFHPVLMPTLGIFIVMVSDPYIYLSLDISQLLPSFLAIVFCTGLCPVIMSWILLKLGRITSITNPTDNDRKQLISFTELFFILSYYVIHNIIPLGKSPECFLIGINLTMITTLIASLVTRVSFHAVGVGGILGTVIGLMYYTRIQMLPLLGAAMVIVFLVGYARYKLKAHAAADIYIGNIIGIACQAFVFFIAAR
ncbi:MAG: hypothetical protein ACLQQ4_05510 [Bacteroidia bacterium]